MQNKAGSGKKPDPKVKEQLDATSGEGRSGPPVRLATRSKRKGSVTFANLDVNQANLDVNQEGV